MNFNLPKHYRHFQRYQQIAQILLKNGLGFIVDNLDLKKYLPFKKRLKIDDDKINKQNLAYRFKNVLQELGPTFIKLGQLMSTRPDVLPPEFIKELRSLQDKVNHLEFSSMETVLIDELGENYRQYFKKIDSEPMATASIAQTHKAILHDGTEVILKIQRPGVKKKSRVDLEILHNLAVIAEERGIFSDFVKPSEVVEEFKDSLFKELDFTREVANMDIFRKNFSGNPAIVVPEVYKKLSSQRLIVMEEIKGIKLNEVTEEKVEGIDTRSLADLGARAFMKQIFIDGFFHGDPHPGNIFIVEGNKLAYIDFGLMGQLTGEIKTQLSTLFFAFMYREPDIIVDMITNIGLVPSDVNFRKIELEIQDLINKYYGQDLGEIELVTVFDDFQRIIYKFNIRMPRDFFILIRAIAVSEGVGYLVDPSFNIVESGKSFLSDLIKSRIEPAHLGKQFIKNIWRMRNSTRRLPIKLGKIIDKIVQDDLTIKFKHMNLEDLINKVDIISNRLSISLIISALIIGSSVILHTDMHPQIFDIPFLGFLGYIIAGVLGFLLVIAIIRSGRF